MPSLCWMMHAVLADDARALRRAADPSPAAAHAPCPLVIPDTCWCCCMMMMRATGLLHEPVMSFACDNFNSILIQYYSYFKAPQTTRRAFIGPLVTTAATASGSNQCERLPRSPIIMLCMRFSRQHWTTDRLAATTAVERPAPLPYHPE